MLAEEVSVCDSHEEEALGSISLKVDYLSKVVGLICTGISAYSFQCVVYSNLVTSVQTHEYLSLLLWVLSRVACIITWTSHYFSNSFPENQMF